MGEYYVKTDVPEFTHALLEELRRRGWKDSTTFPVDLVFVSGQHGYYRNRINTKKSTWISLLHGPSVERLCEKEALHRLYGSRGYFIPTQFASVEDMPRISGGYPKIIKPTKGFAGSGIRIVNSKTELHTWMATHLEYSDWMIQSYVKSPALLNGHKFHLRVLVMIVQPHDGERQVYVANKGFYVPAKLPYVQGEWENTDIHDTHYRPGLVRMYPDVLPDDWKTGSMRPIHTILADLLKEESQFRPEWNAVNGFEVFGADILFDKRSPRLLEFNNKMSLKGRESYAVPILSLLLDGNDQPYFTRIV